MKTLQKIIKAYEFCELSEEAKEKARDNFIRDEGYLLDDLFYEEITGIIEEKFPKSDLKVQYSLSYCQGDGLNIYGRFELSDFLPFWEASEKDKRTIQFYLYKLNLYYNFSYNRHYCYSCKFIDIKDIEEEVEEAVEELSYYGYKNIKKDVVLKFYRDCFGYIEELENNFEKAGYEELYEVPDDFLEDFSEANDLYYDIAGNVVPSDFMEA